MKRLLAFFTPLLLVVSCTKDTDLSLVGDVSGEAVTFTATMEDITQSRATLKNAWSGDEEIALFIDDDDDETVYHFTVATDGIMSCDDDIIIDRNDETTYTAFYPYNADLKTVAAYEAAITAGEVDYMTATTTTTGADVELPFKHQLAALTFTITIAADTEITAISLYLDGDINSSNATTLVLGDVTTIDSGIKIYTANYFEADGTDISSAFIIVEQAGYKSYHFIAREENILEAGKQYPFSCAIGDLPIGSTEDNPYVVYSADDLGNIGSSWSLSSHYILACDLDLEGVNFTPIGSESSPFTGSFDGGGFEISDLNIYSTKKYQGLFGYISGATIKNLGVSGSVTGANDVGGVVGYSSASSVTNCYNACVVKIIDTVGLRAGGVVGSSSASSVTNCYNIGEVNGNDTTGGVVGVSSSSSSVTNCYNIGEVNGYGYVGGVVASSSSSSSVANCYNIGEVNGNSVHVGGVMGYNSSTVTNCYNAGSVNGTGYVGGVVGSSYSSSYSSSSVTNCYNAGSVTWTGNYVGGVVGYNNSSTVSYCYYDKEVVTGVTGAVSGADSGTNYCGLTTEEMQGDASTSGMLLYYFTQGGSTSWSADSDKINDGYPILTWQE